jgi:hypothetical protein
MAAVPSLNDVAKDLLKPIESLDFSSSSVLFAIFTTTDMAVIGDIANQLNWSLTDPSTLPATLSGSAGEFIYLCRKITSGGYTELLEIATCKVTMHGILDRLRARADLMWEKLSMQQQEDMVTLAQDVDYNLVNSVARAILDKTELEAAPGDHQFDIATIREQLNSARTISSESVAEQDKISARVIDYADGSASTYNPTSNQGTESSILIEMVEDGVSPRPPKCAPVVADGHTPHFLFAGRQSFTYPNSDY